MSKSASLDSVKLTLNRYDAAKRQDIHGVTRFFDPSPVWDMADAGIGTFEGFTSIASFITDWWATWEDHSREVQEIAGFGGGTVFAAIREAGRLANSHGLVEQLRGFVLLWADELIVHLTAYLEVDQARAAAEIVRRGYHQFATTGQIVAEDTAPDFVWDMSNFHGWPEQALYEGVEGAQVFQSMWTAAWDDWELDVEALHDAGDKVVVLVRQRGRSKTVGLPVDMSFAQIWTLRDGRSTRMEMYSDSTEALKAVGLGE